MARGSFARRARPAPAPPGASLERSVFVTPFKSVVRTARRAAVGRCETPSHGIEADGGVELPAAGLGHLGVGHLNGVFARLTGLTVVGACVHVRKEPGIA